MNNRKKWHCQDLLPRRFRPAILSILLQVCGLYPIYGQLHADPSGRGPLSLSELREAGTTRRLLVEYKAYEKELLRELESAEDDSEADDIEDNLEIIRYAGNELKIASRRILSEKETLSLNAKSDRIIRAVAQPIKSTGLPPLPTLYRNIVLGGLIGQPAPGRSSTGKSRPETNPESAFLYRPEDKSFYSPTQLASLTPLEISELDVSPDHPFWYDADSHRRMRPDPVSVFEMFMEQGTREELVDDGHSARAANYSLQAARRVLFLEDIYRSATSPKGTAEDVYGVEWKIKWGDEAAIEPVAARLYLLAGGRMTDLTYSSGFGKQKLVLVLPPKKEEDVEDEEERVPASLNAFKEALTDLYGFDIAPYISDSGTITSANAGEILEHLPPGGKSKYDRAALHGRQWIAFRESSLELKTKGFIRRLDGARMSDSVATNDRAARGSYIFDMWIANRDVKDDNNKSYFIKRPRGGEMKITEFREGHHDLGLSLGSLWSAGEVNRFRTGAGFARQGLFGKVRIRQAVLFRPQAWEAATWADCRWMTGRIAEIPEEAIRSAVQSSGWPDFMVDSLTYRLLNRREQLARLFDVEMTATSRPPSLTWSLKTPEEILAVERHYQLIPGSLARALEESRRPIKFETVMTEGEIISAENSDIVRLLTLQRYPSGLATRYRRSGDKPPKATRR